MTATSTQSKPKLTFEQFIKYPLEDGRYELVNGEIVQILATRQHEDIADFIANLMKAEVEPLNLNYKVSGRITIATTTKDGKEQGRFPDVSVVSHAIASPNLAGQIKSGNSADARRSYSCSSRAFAN